MNEQRTTSNLPRWVGGMMAALALLLYGATLFLVPDILDWATGEGGKAMKLVAVIGAAIVMMVYWGAESLTKRWLPIR